MTDTILRECGCGATFIPAGDELECSHCAGERHGRIVTPVYKPEPLFYAPEPLCGQLPMGDARHGR